MIVTASISIVLLAPKSPEKNRLAQCIGRAFLAADAANDIARIATGSTYLVLELGGIAAVSIPAMSQHAAILLEIEGVWTMKNLPLFLVVVIWGENEQKSSWIFPSLAEEKKPSRRTCK
jgi:selenophosphate synthetase-related protein